ncbi:hypothetical protein lacNasYZ02_03900 [Lactobacillus nasalidis]|nr:hypothetical protein lacNasYZ01_13620 [Lactobacillus nasalidis]GHV98960.1 hypothetical protein lacNasYZ02_03900 [Lactobacillus nasalidis]
MEGLVLCLAILQNSTTEIYRQAENSTLLEEKQTSYLLRDTTKREGQRSEKC